MLRLAQSTDTQVAPPGPGGRFRPGLRLCLAAWLFLTAGSAAGDGLHGVRTGKHGDSLRVVLDLEGTPPCRLEPVTDSNDWVIVAGGICPLAHLPYLNLDHPLIRSIDASCVGSDLYLYLHAVPGATAHGFSLAASNGRPSRFVVDLYPAPVGEGPVEPVPVSEEARAQETQPEPAVQEAPQPRRRGNWRILIDPGHGGRDPGAHARGLREKDLVFDIGARIAKNLNHTEGFEARLSRKRDQYLGLGQRRRLGEAYDADAFVSIHANSFRKSQVQGVEVYFLSLRGASDEASRELARLENEADPEYNPDEDGLPDGIPFSFDLRQNDTLQRSSALAESTLARIEESDLAASRGVKQAGFAVLKSYEVPSILVEVGFLSNPEEARRLKSTRYRAKVATAIADGLISYLKSSAHARAQEETGSP